MADRSLPARLVDQPQPGTFEMRLVRGGPLVGARIIHEHGLWSASIDGEPCGDAAADPALAAKVCDIWNHASPIPWSLYDYRLQVRSWALANDPTHPAANPRQAIDLGSRRPLF